MKNRFTRILSGAAACLMAAVLAAGCASTPSGSSSAPADGASAAKSAVRIQTIKGPTGIGMVHLMDAQ